MKEIRAKGNDNVLPDVYRAATVFIGTEAEMNSLTIMVPGDEFHVEDAVNKKMLASYIYSGRAWNLYMTYDV